MSLRCAVVGGGVMGVLHARAYERLPGVKLAGLVEPDARRAQELQDLGCPVVRDASELGQVDAASICTPDNVRLSTLRPLLLSGTALLIEKPFATSVDECRAIMELAGPNQVMVGQLMRFDPRVSAVRRAVVNDTFGDLWTGRVWRCSNTSTAARVAHRTSVAWFLGIHDADLVRYLTGKEVKAVRATGRSIIGPNYDIVRGSLELETGADVGFDWSWVWPEALPSGMTAGIELIGSEGAVTSDLGHNNVHVVERRTSRHRVPDVFHWPAGHGGVQVGDIAEEIAQFVDAVASGQAMPVSSLDATSSVAVIEAVQKSCANDGSRVLVQL